MHPSDNHPNNVANSSHSNEPLVNTAAVAQYLGTSRWTVQQLVRDQSIPYHRIRTNNRFRLSEIDSWLESNRARYTSPSERGRVG